MLKWPLYISSMSSKLCYFKGCPGTFDVDLNKVFFVGNTLDDVKRGFAVVNSILLRGTRSKVSLKPPLPLLLVLYWTGFY